mmetsp:Transcript_18217/g.29619  ORF Transcript_18217/g.29619 Transcript_18217/m.29619 type:complete len:314 (+) Transcript_18217:94-1035(+)
MGRRKRSKSPSANRDANRDSSGRRLVKSGSYVSYERVACLYMDSGRDDNEVDDKTFLKRMWIEHCDKQAVSSLIGDTIVVAQQVSLVLCVYLSYLFHEANDVTEMAKLNLVLGALLVGVLLVLFWDVTGTSRTFPRVERLVLCLLLTATCSPLLHTLTESYSSDTVFTLAAVCAVLHLYLYDFGPRIDCVMSRNFGFLMCLLLSSRLNGTEAVASFLLLCIFLLAIVPQMVWSLRKNYPLFSSILIPITNLGWCIAICLGLDHFRLIHIRWLYIIVQTLITLVSPLALWFLQGYKHVIRGPWDVASVEQVASI